MTRQTQMLQRLKSLFQNGQSTERVAEMLGALGEDLDDVAARDYPAKLLIRAAEKWVKAGDDARALACFGCTIEVYLELGCFAEAAVVCQRVVSLYPQVVRARCTLAFLLLGQALPIEPFQELLECARRQVGEYVGAAHRAGRQDLAAKRLRLMASVTDRHELRALIGEYLADLGDHAGANQIFSVIRTERAQQQPPATQDQYERWVIALRVSVVSATLPSLLPSPT